MTQFETVLYATDGAVATITLNRPEHLNTIVPPMPDEVEAAIGLAERDSSIKVIVLRGAGRAFSGGYDFGGGFQHWGESMMSDGRWDPGKDFAMVSGRATGPTQKFMAIWRATKPVIAQVHGWCVGGASDYALCADLVIANDSGPMHIAAAQGRPLVTLFGPTNPVRTGPYRRDDTVLRLDLPCSPCYSRTCSHQSCLRWLTTEPVLAAAEAQLAAESVRST